MPCGRPAVPLPGRTCCSMSACLIVAVAKHEQPSPPLRGADLLVPLACLCMILPTLRSYISPLLQGIRMLIGGAVAAAAREGRRVQPVFSLYAPHGPCFRAMLRVS